MDEYTPIQLKNYDGTVQPARLQDDRLMFIAYRGRDKEPVPAVYLKSTSYKAGGIKEEYWGFYAWSDSIADRLTYG